jgi:hypothetical protein
LPGVSAMVPDLDALVPAAVASDRLGVSLQVIYAWRTKGWLDPASGQRVTLKVRGQDGRARLYRWGDLCEAERSTRRSPKSRRRLAGIG